MKFKFKGPKGPKEYDTRFRTPFAWVPVRMKDGTWVWLERYTVHEVFYTWTVPSYSYLNNGFWSLVYKATIDK